MPPSDYRPLMEGVAAAPIAVIGLRGKLRALWNRLFH
jgi:hypothetical protein